MGDSVGDDYAAFFVDRWPRLTSRTYFCADDFASWNRSATCCQVAPFAKIIFTTNLRTHAGVRAAAFAGAVELLDAWLKQAAHFAERIDAL